MASSVRRSLEGTLESYYAQYRFADVFASAERVPEEIAQALAALPEIAAVETRILAWGALMPIGMDEPVIGRVVSLPDGRDPGVNRIVLRSGRMLDPGNRDEVIIAEPFAEAHGLRRGQSLLARIGGERRELNVVGLALAPEAVFALGPGQLVPDDRRFGLLWMGKEALADALGLDNMFNDVVLRLRSPEDETEVIRQLDMLLSPYGGVAAYARAAHPSHAFVQGQLDQLAALSLLLPPLFLLVAGFLLYGALQRTVDTERSQIGILKALGIKTRTIRGHYLLYSAVIAASGCLLGFALGSWMGVELTQLYARVFRFPLIVHESDIAAMMAASAAAIVVALGAATAAVHRVVCLEPAEAMRPKPPSAYDKGGHEWGFGERSRMVWRQLHRRKGRAGLTCGATALSIALIIATLFSFDALDHIVEVTGNSERQDATLLFPGPLPADALNVLRGLPGVRRAEGFRTSTAEIVSGEGRESVPLVGLPQDGTLRQLLAPDLSSIAPPADGIALTATLADQLRVRPGDEVTLHLPNTAPFQVRVAKLTEQYFGVEASVALTTLNRWLGEEQRVSGARVDIDPGARREFHSVLSDTPLLAGYVDKQATLSAFRTTMSRTLTILVSFFVLFAVLTTLGVVYSNARLLLTERQHDLAILSALGFSGTEVAALLLAELLLPALIAVPIGVAIGRLFGWIVVQGLDSGLFRIPLVVEPGTDFIAIAVTMLASLAAAFLIARAAVRQNMVSALAAPE
jgi:putative ABC transport system permease protein